MSLQDKLRTLLTKALEGTELDLMKLSKGCKFQNPL